MCSKYITRLLIYSVCTSLNQNSNRKERKVYLGQRTLELRQDSQAALETEQVTLDTDMHVPLHHKFAVVRTGHAEALRMCV